MSRYYARALFNPVTKQECNLSVAFGYDHTPIGLFIQIYEPIEETDEEGNRYMNEDNLVVDKDMMFSNPPLTSEEFLALCNEWKINLPSEVEYSIKNHFPF